MRKIVACLLLISCIGSVAYPAKKASAPEGSPLRAIQDLEAMLDSYILRPKTPEEKQFNADLKKRVIHGTFDIRELCRLSLDKHWDDLKEGQRDYHVDVMTRLLERKAIFSKEQGGGGGGKGAKVVYTITYEGEKFLNPEKNLAVVKTLVRIPSENLKIGLNYKVMQSGSGWMIYDVIVDDASLVDNYRYQFDKIIREHGYEDLVRRMESKLKEIEQKDGVATSAAEPTPPKQKSGCGLIRQSNP